MMMIMMKVSSKHNYSVLLCPDHQHAQSLTLPRLQCCASTGVLWRCECSAHSRAAFAAGAGVAQPSACPALCPPSPVPILSVTHWTHESHVAGAGCVGTGLSVGTGPSVGTGEGCMCRTLWHSLWPYQLCSALPLLAWVAASGKGLTSSADSTELRGLQQRGRAWGVKRAGAQSAAQC